MRRDELYDAASEDEGLSNDAVGDEAMRAQLDAQLSSLFAVDFGEPTSKKEAGEGLTLAASQTADPTESQEQEEEEFEFRLFSTAKAGPQKVILEHEDDNLQNKEGGLVVRDRPASFYLAEEATPEQRACYSLAAITADDIYALSKKRAWGLEVPWRVRKITLSRSRLRALSTDTSDSPTPPIQEEEQSSKRKRPGKKRRVLLRTKEKAKKEQQAAAEKQKVSKEEHLKEKKKRLNREKKLKRRQKDKEKKQGQAAAGSQLQDDGNAGGQQEGSESESD